MMATKPKKRISKRKRSAAVRVKVAVPNSIRNWLEQNYVVNDVATIRKTKLYEEYVRFCEENNLTPKQSNIFGRMLSQTFPSVYTRRIGPKGHQVCHYAGIQHYKSAQPPSTPNDASSNNTTTSTSTPTTIKKIPYSAFPALFKQQLTTTTTTHQYSIVDASDDSPPPTPQMITTAKALPIPPTTSTTSTPFLSLLQGELHTTTWANVSTTTTTTSQQHQQLHEETWDMAIGEGLIEEDERDDMELQDLLDSLRDMPTPPALDESPQLLAASLSFLELDSWSYYSARDSPMTSSEEDLSSSPSSRLVSPSSSGEWDPCAEFLL